MSGGLRRFCRKRRARTRVLGGLGLGSASLWHLFNVVVASLLSCVWQVARLPESASWMLKVLIACVSRLPTRRVSPWVFVQVRDVGFGHAFQDIVRTNLDAMAQVPAASLWKAVCLAGARELEARPSGDALLSGLAPGAFPGWSESLLAGQVVEARTRVVRIRGHVIRWDGPQVVRALRSRVPLGEFGALFAAWLRSPLRR